MGRGAAAARGRGAAWLRQVVASLFLWKRWRRVHGLLRSANSREEPMPTLFVDVEGLNLRSSAKAPADNRLGVLHLCQPVELIEDKPAGWRKVRATVDGQAQTGFVKAVIDPQPATGFVPRPSLREPASPAREALVAQAIAQWLRFEKGQGKEHVAPFAKFVGQMWKAIGLNLDGTDSGIPWSAAAISFMVRGAAAQFPAYTKFKFAAAHSKYLHDSVVKRGKNDTSAPFWGFQLFEAKPQLGDIVGKWREVPRTFQDVVNSDSFKSHTDIIVATGPDFVIGLGGNVSDSVSLTRYAKAASGHLAGSDGVIALMVNRAD
jgi:hypothetical protein